MHLILLTQYYPPETGAPQNRLSDLAGRLTQLDHRVTVFTAMPNYPAGVIHEGYRRKIYTREIIGRVEIHRSWIYATTSRKVLPRLLNYFSFVLSSLLVGALFLTRADFLMLESPPLFLGISAYLLAKLKRARLIVNVADLWPKAAVDMKVITNKWLIGGAIWLEEFLYRKAALITAQTQGIVNDIQCRVPDKVVRLMTNGADTSRFGIEKANHDLLREFDLEGRFIAGYAGIHGPAQALDKVVDAAEHLRDQPEIVIAFFGEGPVKAELQERAREKGLDNVRFFPLQSRDRIVGLIALWGVGLVPLYDSPLMSAALPSKMFEVMGSGIPVLLSAPQGEASAVIEAARGGVWVKPENPPALADAIKKLHRDTTWRLELGRNARSYVRQYYSRQAIAGQFLQYLSEQMPGQIEASGKPATA